MLLFVFRPRTGVAHFESVPHLRTHTPAGKSETGQIRATTHIELLGQLTGACVVILFIATELTPTIGYVQGSKQALCNLFCPTGIRDIKFNKNALICFEKSSKSGRIWT